MIGQSVVDYLMTNDRFDPLYNQNYSALNCKNNPEIAERCKIKGAPRVIYAIKANAVSNNQMILGLRSGFQSGYINLLVDEATGEEMSEGIKGYDKLSESIKAKMSVDYVETSMLVEELVNLTHETSNHGIKVKERSGMRKDKFSSCLYGYAVVQELAQKLKPNESINDVRKYFNIRKPRSSRQFS